MGGRSTGIQIQITSVNFPVLVCAWEHEKQIVCVCVCYCDRAVSGEIRHHLPVDPVYFLAGFTRTITVWASV